MSMFNWAPKSSRVRLWGKLELRARVLASPLFALRNESLTPLRCKNGPFLNGKLSNILHNPRSSKNEALHGRRLRPIDLPEAATPFLVILILRPFAGKPTTPLTSAFSVGMNWKILLSSLLLVIPAGTAHNLLSHSSAIMTSTAHRKAVVGNPSSSFWLYDSNEGFDLTHPPTTNSPSATPHITIKTTTVPITIAPAKSALVIIDMQNFFLSPQLGRPLDSKGLLAQKELLDHAIPAARKAGIRVIWLNWGLTQEEIDNMPPATLRAFGFETVAACEFESFDSVSAKEVAIDSHGVNEAAPAIAKQQAKSEPRLETSGKSPRIYRGLGSPVGEVTLEDGSKVDGGRLLMRGAWNSDLTPELSAAYKEGLSASPPDVWIHKNRMSGLWGPRTLCTDFLEKEGIKTLLFAGVNTDQCVGGSLQDAFTKGYDCILLSDGSATTSPSSSQESVEFNCAKTWGFCVSCKIFKEEADGIRS